MNTPISKSKFKAHALEIFRRVERTGEAVIITDHGTPKLVVERYAKPGGKQQDRLKGSVLRYDAPLEPVGEAEWESSA